MGEFRGTKKNEKQFKKLEHIRKKAKELVSIQSPVFRPEMHCGGTDNTHRSAVVSIEARNPMVIMNDDQRDIIAEMMLLADDTVVAIVEGTDRVRISFGVRDIWLAE